MILSRVIEHVKHQNWMAVFLDFVIVVMGVFIGIQLGNLNEARVDRGVAARHLTEIAEDLQSYLSLYNEFSGSALARIAAVDYIYDKAFKEKLPKAIHMSVSDYNAPETGPYPPEDLNNLLGAIDLVRISVGSRNGYESLISSGHLGLIQNKNLARDLQNYYSHYDDLLDTGNGVFRTFRTDAASLLYKYGLSVFDERQPEDIIAIARDHPDFAAYLRTQREWAILHANLLERQRSETVDLLAKIKTELKHY